MINDKYLKLLMPRAGLEPAQSQGPRDFKSLASANSATQALFTIIPSFLSGLFSARRGSDQYFRDRRNRVYNSLRPGTYNLLYRKDICPEEHLPRKYTHNLNIATESCFTSVFLIRPLLLLCIYQELKVL